MEKFTCKDYIDKDYVDNLLKTAIRIFDGEAPGSEGIELDENVTQEDWDCGLKKVVANHTLVPVLIPMIPENPNGMAIMVIPGSAYRRQVLSQEGVEVGKWLNSMGITAFVLRHRLPADAHNRRVDVPLIDAQRAIRFIRYNADKYGICADKVGVMGFSAADIWHRCFQPVTTETFILMKLIINVMILIS